MRKSAGETQTLSLTFTHWLALVVTIRKQHTDIYLCYYTRLSLFISFTIFPMDWFKKYSWAFNHLIHHLVSCALALLHSYPIPCCFCWIKSIDVKIHCALSGFYCPTTNVASFITTTSSLVNSAEESLLFDLESAKETVAQRPDDVVTVGVILYAFS